MWAPPDGLDMGRTEAEEKRIPPLSHGASISFTTCPWALGLKVNAAASSSGSEDLGFELTIASLGLLLPITRWWWE